MNKEDWNIKDQIKTGIAVSLFLTFPVWCFLIALLIGHLLGWC